MRTTSKLAVTTMVLSVSGVVLTLSHVVWLLLLAVALGFVATGTGALALWSIHRPRADLRGKRVAVAGMALAGLVRRFGLLVLAFMLWQAITTQPPVWAPTGQEFIPSQPLPDKPATHFNSNLPIVVLETRGQEIEKERKTLVRAIVLDLKDGRASLDSRTNYDGFALLHLHGSTTSRLPKRSFRFEAVDGATNHVKVSLLGLPEDDDWILYAPFEDKTMMRDVLAYELASRMGRYAPRTKYVELFLRSSDRPLSMQDYAGVYLLVEKIKRGKERVSIARLEPGSQSEPDITGGYIVKRDHGERSGKRFYTSRGGPYFHVYPKAENITREQQIWLERYLTAFESALYGEAFADPEHGYAAYLDVDSFIDAHWLIEAGRNVDGFRYSAFLTKDRGGKLKPGPPWDWNRSFGNANYYGGWQVQGWHWPRLRPTELSWFHRLREDPEFVGRCTRRWVELRRDVFDPQRISARVDELAAQLEEAQKRNYQRWPILDQHITCNYYVGGSYAEEVAWLKRWIIGRIAWIDSHLDDAAAPGEPFPLGSPGQN